MKKEKLKEREINQKTHIKLHTSQNKGITLIALIITIIVLLILAVVAIRAVQGDGIISKAKEAQTKYEDAQNEEEIKLALNEWKIVGATTNKTFSEFMAEKFGENKVQAGSSESEVIVTLANGSQFKVTEDGTITSTKGIVLSPSPMTLELNEGTTVTGNLTARLNGIEGAISWSNSDNTKATISAETGDSITVTAVAKGSTTITATCGSYKATCKVTVEEPIQVGSYVEYDLEYEDMYSGIIYNENNGWRYLGKDDNGNNLIVSTGIPAILYYHYNSNIGNTADGGGNSWWATIAEISSENTPAIYRTTKGYDYNKDSGEPNKYAAYGLRYKFESIPFTYQASGTNVSTANKGIFRKVGSTISGTDINLNFRASGVNVVDVHNLTLAELNRATNKATTPEGTRAETSTSSGFKDLTGTANGLFDMQDLENYTQSYYYWLASPDASFRNGVYSVRCNDSSVNSYNFYSVGVRPVVTLPSNVNLTVVNN